MIFSGLKKVQGTNASDDDISTGQAGDFERLV